MLSPDRSEGQGPRRGRDREQRSDRPERLQDVQRSRSESRRDDLGPAEVGPRVPVARTGEAVASPVRDFLGMQEATRTGDCLRTEAKVALPRFERAATDNLKL